MVLLVHCTAHLHPSAVYCPCGCDQDLTHHGRTGGTGQRSVDRQRCYVCFSIVGLNVLSLGIVTEMQVQSGRLGLHV